MQKRTFIFEDYDTAAHGWTLTGWKLSDAEQKTKYVEKTGGDGSWDLSTVMSDGIPRYAVRSLTVNLECSEGTRTHREELISEMVNKLDGMEWNIYPPDHPNHYLLGRLHVAVNYNDLVHASVTVSATCNPWLYKKNQTHVAIDATATEQTAVLSNQGRRATVPVITVEDNVLLVYGNSSIALGEGTYEWPDLLLTPGNHAIKYSGAGSVIFTYREAVLR